MKYLNKIIFINSANIPYAEISGMVMCISQEHKAWAKVPF